LQEIEKRQVEAAKKDPIAEIDKAPLIIGDEVVKFSSSSKPEEEKKAGEFHFEVVNKDNLSPPEIVEKHSSSDGSDDIEDLGKDSYYVNSYKTEEESKESEEQGFWDLKMLNPAVDVVFISKDEYN
jgi:hypothetical protein